MYFRIAPVSPFVWLLALLLAAFALLQAGAAQAAQFPSKPMRIIVPFTPGGFNDQLARVLGQKFTERWGQPVVIDNRPGGSTVIGTGLAARAPADGHTLLIVSFAFAVNPSLMGRLPYQTPDDFTPVVLAAGTPNYLVVHPSLPVHSVKDLIALAKAKPGSLDYATGGSGTSNHLCMELLKSIAGIDLVQIPYKGSAPAVTDVIGGQVKVMFDNAPNVLPHVRAGKLRAIAVSSRTRAALSPEIPTLAESGVPGFEVDVWFGVVAPAGTPKEVVATLNTEINRVLALPQVKQRFAQQGVHTIGGTPQAFDAYLRGQMTRWAKVVKQAGVKIQ